MGSARSFGALRTLCLAYPCLPTWVTRPERDEQFSSPDTSNPRCRGIIDPPTTTTTATTTPAAASSSASGTNLETGAPPKIADLELDGR